MFSPLLYMKINTKTKTAPIYTNQGGRAVKISPIEELRRTVMSCLLWEASFTESGEDIAERLKGLIAKCDAFEVAGLAVAAREQFKLRHVPLFLVREMARNENQKFLVADTLSLIIQRADELAEFLSIYWKDGKDQPISAQVKKGLARAFIKFDEHSLSKYNGDKDIKLRDVLFLTHPKPQDNKQEKVWKKLANNQLESPDTWEVALSSGADKKETFERLIIDEKLGALALLRNLRGMTEAGVDRDLIEEALLNINTERVLPFRFISAARYAPHFEPQLEKGMLKALEGAEKMQGKTILLIDVSGSMNAAISAKSDLTRIDAACALAILLREICDDVRVYTFSDNIVEVPARRGFALRDAINNSQKHSSTEMTVALNHINYGAGADRLIVISDEQVAQAISSPKTSGYMLNVSSDKNGVGYGKWLHIDGWSEQVVKYIAEIEKES